MDAQFCLLGPLQVRFGGKPVAVPAGKQRAVLAALLLQANQVVPADDLVDIMWGTTPPPTARAGLHNCVKRLRDSLGPVLRARVITDAGGYMIAVREGELDVTRFVAQLQEARAAHRAANWQAAARLAQEALSLWRGQPLAGVASEVLAVQEASRLAELRLRAVETRIGAMLQLGEHSDVIDELRQLTAAAPLREHFHALLMLALYREGRQAEALAAYQHARTLLMEELAAEPGPELRLLQQRILTADPALSRPAPSAAVQQTAGQVVPRQLPAPVRHFTGRRAELSQLTDLVDLAADGAVPALVICAVGGTAGVGKTALAIQWAHQVAARFPDGQLYVNLRGYDPSAPVAPADALAGLLRALGVPGKEIPDGADDRAGLYRSRLAGRRLLVVLDNARDSDQVRPLLPGDPGCVAVVTSRDSLAGLVVTGGARRLDLDVLPSADAVALLRSLIGPRADQEPEAVATLSGLCARLPLALRIAAELAAARSAVPLAGLVAELARSRLDLLEAGEDRADVRRVFSWSLGYLSPAAAQAFRFAAMHPGADFDTYAVTALTGTSYPATVRALAELVRSSLLHQAGSGRYAMHDLLRAYAAELAAVQDPECDRREALTRLFDHYLDTVQRAAGILFPADATEPDDAPTGDFGLELDDEHAARGWLDANRANLTAVAGYASKGDWPRHVAGLSSALFRYLHAGGFLAEALVIHGAAAEAAARLGDATAEASAVNNAGTVFMQLGRYKEAEQHFQRAVRLSREAGGQAIELRAQLNLAEIYLRMGAYPEAVASCQHALELSRASSDRIREARALMYLGLIALRQDRYERAAADLAEAAEAIRAVGDLPFLTVSLTHLGYAEVRQRQYQQARRHLQEARTTARQIGHGILAASAISVLGFADLREGRHQQAARHLQQALATFQDAGISGSAADVLCNLGELDLRRGYPAQAAERYQQALTICRQVTDPAGEAEARNGLGDAARAAGAPEDARVHHEAALAIASEIRKPEQQARAHEGLANISAADGDAAGARSHWQCALDLYTTMGTADAGRVRALLAHSSRSISARDPSGAP